MLVNLTITESISHIESEYGVIVKMSCLRTAIRRKKLKAVKLRQCGWYIITPQELKRWLIVTKRIQEKEGDKSV